MKLIPNLRAIEDLDKGQTLFYSSNNTEQVWMQILLLYTGYGAQRRLLRKLVRQVAHMKRDTCTAFGNRLLLDIVGIWR